MLWGRGKGCAISCWHTDGNCNLGSATDPNPWQGPTFKFSNDWINQFHYTRIRMSRWDEKQKGQYWRGKDDGGCRYQHTPTANGPCNCAADNPEMTADYRCGRPHGGHDGVGDWPYNGNLHSRHSGGHWYYNGGSRGCSSHNSGPIGCCSGGSCSCSITMWIR